MVGHVRMRVFTAEVFLQKKSFIRHWQWKRISIFGRTPAEVKSFFFALTSDSVATERDRNSRMRDAHFRRAMIKFHFALTLLEKVKERIASRNRSVDPFLSDFSRNLRQKDEIKGWKTPKIASKSKFLDLWKFFEISNLFALPRIILRADAQVKFKDTSRMLLCNDQLISNLFQTEWKPQMRSRQELWLAQSWKVK